jgi:hypothetical protein
VNLEARTEDILIVMRVGAAVAMDPETLVFLSFFLPY